ncbi:hypothetical protein LTR56_010432 [Elasticomyces elasticus]|nr:hypothetical protein LTR56_010432 [Elasticomyces elasticus]KAK3648476.1 hypothetical protein LTR22_013368 [Elasticomyces elasticus]KAK4916785.1 hypothetical protein LTR49_015229 [Elasticomyces elasticus]KAK5755935.1 hypothetical protein LTS12_013939 [Elasticomyces elasticus]
MSFPGPPTPGQVPQPFQGAPTPTQQPMSPYPQQAQLEGSVHPGSPAPVQQPMSPYGQPTQLANSEYPGSPVLGQQQMQPFGQQGMVPQQQAQWQYAGTPLAQQQQQAATTTQTTTTATSLRYSVQQQTPYLYASTPQPVQYQYPQTQQALQYGSLNSAVAFGQQQQAPQTPQPVPQTPQPVQYGSGSQAQSSSSQAMTTQQQAPHTPGPNYSHLYKSPAPATPAPVPAPVTTNSTTTTQTQTLQYEGSTTGGQSHQVAASQGQTQQFETKVQTMIASLGACPSNYQWYHTDDGYLCAGGNHEIHYMEIDKWQRNSRYRPKVQLVNTLDDPNSPFDPFFGGPTQGLMVHPPNVDLWQPMHALHHRFMVELRRRGFMTSYGGVRCPCADELGIPKNSRRGTQAALQHDDALLAYGSTGGRYGAGYGAQY